MLKISALLALLAAPVAAVECQSGRFQDNRYTWCEVDATTQTIRMFLRDEKGEAYGDFAALPDGVAMAMNGGMYHADRDPVGHYIEDGVEQMRVITSDGPGNFGLLPNGVFCIREGRADVIESRAYAQRPPGCTHATQSGPMLVIDGALHPRFLPDSDSRKRRNGVGTSADGTRVVFAITDNAVTFHEFGTFFRDGLGLPQALFLDGSISRLYAPGIGRRDAGMRMGPIVTVMED
ncbi:MAG: phosphodiester glycosidase family protein [Shimia sp.]